jgi:hypothetical protein
MGHHLVVNYVNITTEIKAYIVVVWFSPLDLTSRLGVALEEPRPSTSYIDRPGALRVFNNLDMTNR